LKPVTAPTLLHLYEAPQVQAEVAAMIYAEFWQHEPGASVEWIAQRLAEATVPDRLPACLVATCSATPIGVVNLIEYDDPNPRIGRPWIAGLVIKAEWRRQGIGTRLVRAALDHARRLGETEAFLATDSPAFYARLGRRFRRRSGRTCG
jgi:predicted N-acetyltransferase YhbS